jgi:hypothetical protein
MKILGRHFSSYWLLLIIPVLAVSLPILLVAMFAASHVVGAIIGPPAIWNRPFASPRSSDLVGSYHETERHWQDGTDSGSASLTLNGDGTMVVTNLPESNGITKCILFASGTWRIERDDDSQIDLTILKVDPMMTCKLEGLPYGISGVLNVTGHSQPYSLYWTLGDPDSGEGIWFRRD